MRKFLFTCGGTAGHINPAIAVAGRLKELLPDASFLFIGAAGMMETELVPREGFPIQTIEISNLSRSLSFQGLKHNLSTVKKVLTGTAAAKKLIRDFGPDVVIGTGGYVCFPVLRAAHALGIPTLVHESNAVPGLTTKLLSRSADCVMLGFEHAKEGYPARAKLVYTGTPVRGGFARMGREEARAKLGIPADRPLLLSVWGSLGSDHMNQMMARLAPMTAQRGDFALIHSAGKRGYARLLNAVGGDAAALKSKGVDLREYIYDMSTVMAAADLIACRSGASTLGELAALGKPALLVPSPNVTNNHQEKNARALERAGAAEVLLEGQFDAEAFYGKVTGLLNSKEKLSAMSAAMRGCGVPDAADRIAALALEYVKN